MDNRLDYISQFNEGGVELMTAYREAYINLDETLRLLISNNETMPVTLHRTLALARTHLESSLMYAIKSVCLRFEKKS
jgi:hypothetical protein